MPSLVLYFVCVAVWARLCVMGLGASMGHVPPVLRLAGSLAVRCAVARPEAECAMALSETGCAGCASTLRGRIGFPEAGVDVDVPS